VKPQITSLKYVKKEQELARGDVRGWKNFMPGKGAYGATT